MGDQSSKSTMWKIVEGVAIAAILAATGFTFSTFTRTQEMQGQLANLCGALPKLESRVDGLTVEIQTGKMLDVEIKGRMFFLEKSLENFEKRLSR